ncbi:MAG: BamA/TamA family outer membrane protein [Ignavibacteriae bacterium]|nr:BamA/TamA family outer membrane protein [Ignavibacteriota bacterium]
MVGTWGGLLLRVEEGKTNTFDGIAGYAPGLNPGDAGYFTGMVTIGMRNLFGTGRKMNLRWQKEDRFSQDLSVGYVEPWLFGFPVNAGADFQQRRQDSTYVRQAGTFTVELMASEELSLSLSGTTESVIPSSDTVTARVPRSSSLGGGAEVLYDTRDDSYSPGGWRTLPRGLSLCAQTHCRDGVRPGCRCQRATIRPGPRSVRLAVRTTGDRRGCARASGAGRWRG